jgi:hypothetical protein
MVVGLGQFPMTSTDMIIQRHGDNEFAQLLINFEQMILFHYWIVHTFVKNFGDGTNL